jgi:glycosyltransferase involved in cell wall biosynthesis
MRFLLLGIESTVLDEGAKNVATNLARALSKTDDVLMFHQRQVLRTAAVLQARRFRPDVVLSVHGPGTRTVLLLGLLRQLTGQPRVALLGTQPHESQRMIRLMRWLRPERIFVQSKQWQERFSAEGQPVSLLPNGVDLEKFSPRHDDRVIAETRRELGVRDNTPMALHVGPLNTNRNHDLLIRLRRELGWEVVVIGSTTEPCVRDVERRLRDAGVHVHMRYFPDISKVYAAADVYVFPVENTSGSIEFPLTVLEAMACDRPVAATRFRGLPDFLPSGKALRFFNDPADLFAFLPALAGQSGNRQRALRFSWDEMARQLRETLLAGTAA